MPRKIPTEMPAPTHTDLVETQFGAMAEAYRVSPAHASGPDLEALVTWARRHHPTCALDVGCGPGHASLAVAPYVGRVVAYDLSKAMLQTVVRSAQERGLHTVEIRMGSAEAMPFGDETFDAVLTRYSAHHWRDLPRALSEMTRVLKPGGRAWIMDVAAPEEPLLDTYLQAIEVFRDPAHVKNRSPSAWQHLLAAAGLHPETTTMARLSLDFQSWVERMRTPPVRVQAIRALLADAPREVRDYLELRTDDSFTIDTLWLEAVKSG